MACCVVAFSKYSDTRSMIHAFAASFIYLLIQVALNYPPLGCLFTNVVVDGSKGFTTETKSFAVIQVVVMVIFVIVYTVVIYRQRIGGEEEEEKAEEA